jgi:site-specific DNA-methyltransferase (adenine-specific)
MKKAELTTEKPADAKPALPAVPLSEVYLEDCVKALKRFNDKHFDLAVVDPPYGIDMSQELFKRGQTCKKNGYKEHLNKDWDKQVPEQDYFDELFRVSKNQIVFGANYMTKYLPESMGWIVWNKVQRGYSFADGELAWTSFKKALRIFDYARGNESGFAPKLKGTERAGINIHPTQKPIALYDWIFANYSERGQIILDTHLGSGSSRIAANKAGINFIGFEVDEDYYERQEKRYQTFISQLRMF